MGSVAEHVPFLHLCKLCQKVSERKGKDKKFQPLKDFIAYWRSFHDKLHATNPHTTDSFYPVLRLLLPHCERQRAAYGIKEFTLAKLLIEIFCLDKNSSDAKKLLNYRSPNSASAEAGDFASVAYFVLKNRSPENGMLTVYDINFHLDEIASSNAAKSKDNVKHSLLKLLRNTSALEQKWLIRMILKDMKLGLSENSVLKAFHADAKDLFDVTNSLEKVCTSLRDPSVRLHEIEISLFSAFRPMLAEIALPNQVENLMYNKPFITETKYDGERLQLHKDGNSYMYFSRGGHDCTATYGCSPLQGSLTPFIHCAFKSEMSSCILDCEVVIYSSKLNCIVSKGENADVQAMEPDGDYGPCLCVFDILMFNGIVLSNKPLKERVSYIKKAFNQIDNKIRYTEQKTITTNEEVVDELNRAIDLRLEGIIIKNPESIYKPNIRKASGWLKIKPEYIDNLMDELDLLIIGGYYGEGRRSTLISHFLLAVASSEQINGEPKYFYSFCKVGSGYSLKELYELSGKLEQHWKPYNPKKPQPNLIISGGRKEQPDVWIEPSKSQIVQVKATEIVRSKVFATDCTLRFPRVEKIRYDKNWTDCMTKREMDDLRNLAQGRLATKSYVNEVEEPSPKKQRIQRENIVCIAPHFRPTDVKDVQQISKLLNDKEFCIIVASLDIKKSVEKLITQHGGKFVQNPGSSTFCVVADRITAKVKNIMNTDAYDVVKVEWLDRCIEKKVLLPWSPEDLLHATEITEQKLLEEYDKFGDSFTEELTVASLKRTFKKIPKEEWESVNMTHEKKVQIEIEYFQDPYPFNIFKFCRIYIDSENPKLTLTTLQLKFYGAVIMSSINDSISHVVIHSSDNESTKEKYLTEEEQLNFYLVTEKWVVDSIQEGRTLEEKNYKAISEEPCDEDSEDLLF